MRGVNKVILLGNAGKEPEVRQLPGGGSVTNLSMATSESWKDKNTGQQQEKTEWHRVVFFNKLAEIVGQYVRKGSKIYIEGKLQTRSWDQDGVTKYATEIVAHEMQLLDSKDGGDRQSHPQDDQAKKPVSRTAAQPSPYAGNPKPAIVDDFDDLDTCPF